MGGWEEGSASYGGGCDGGCGGNCGGNCGGVKLGWMGLG